jgi:hypothetical protein
MSGLKRTRFTQLLASKKIAPVVHRPLLRLMFWEMVQAGSEGMLEKWKPGFRIVDDTDDVFDASIPEGAEAHNSEFYEGDEFALLKRLIHLDLCPDTRTWAFQVDQLWCVKLANHILSHWDTKSNVFSFASKDTVLLPGGWSHLYEKNVMSKGVKERPGLDKARVEEVVKSKQSVAVLDFERLGTHRTVFNDLQRDPYFKQLLAMVKFQLFGIEQVLLRIQYVHFITFVNRSVVYTYHKDSTDNGNGVASSKKGQTSTNLTVVCQLSGDTTNMNVLGATAVAPYDSVGSCQAFPADVFHRSGTTTSSTVKIVLGLDVKKLVVHPDLSDDTGEETTKEAAEPPSNSAGASRSVDPGPSSSGTPSGTNPEGAFAHI